MQYESRSPNCNRSTTFINLHYENEWNTNARNSFFTPFFLCALSLSPLYMLVYTHINGTLSSSSSSSSSCNDQILFRLVRWCVCVKFCIVYSINKRHQLNVKHDSLSVGTVGRSIVGIWVCVAPNECTISSSYHQPFD